MVLQETVDRYLHTHTCFENPLPYNEECDSNIHGVVIHISIFMLKFPVHPNVYMI